MKKFLLLICGLIGLTLSLTAQTVIQTRSYTLEEALELVKISYPQEDADYFAIDSEKISTTWTIFVDPSPMQGWEHECYTFKIPKTSPALTGISPNSIVKTTYMLPPPGSYTPLETKNRYGENAKIKPIVTASPQPNDIFGTPLPNTYAIIISGGVNKQANYPRYWNDCSYIYQVLTKRYNISKDNIYAIMADGDDKTVIDKSTFQSLDLDFDGEDEVIIEASKENIRNTLSHLSGIMKKNEHLFIFVIDHGGARKTDDGSDVSYICLWDPDNLSETNPDYHLQDFELSKMLIPFVDKKVNINVVLGQCNSGGFVDDLSKLGCVVATACKGTEPSWSMGDLPYDEFVYHWTCAVNGHDHKGNILISDADYDNDGHISMEEAFLYAKKNDRRYETPQYCSTPASVGEDLAFDRAPELVNLYIRDNYSDTGKEPNNSTDIIWDSPDIWMRNNDDGIATNENININGGFTKATFYVTINNRGIHDYNFGQWLHLYWAKNSTSPAINTWNGTERYNNQPTGGFLTSVEIPAISGSSGITLPVTCLLPSAFSFSSPLKYNLNVLAVISNSETPMDFTLLTDSNTHLNPASYKTVAQKSVTEMAKTQLASTINTLIRNGYNAAYPFNLIIKGRGNVDNSILNYATITFQISDKLLNDWTSVGCVMSGLTQSTTNKNEFKITSLPAILGSIPLQSKQIEDIRFNITFGYNIPNTSQHYTLDLIQELPRRGLTTGTTISVQSPSKLQGRPEIAVNSLDDGSYKLEVVADDNTSTTWFDTENEIIGTDRAITVTPSKNKSCYVAATLDTDGNLSVGDVSLNSVIGIKSLHPTVNVDTSLSITLKEQTNLTTGHIEISPVQSLGTTLSIPIEMGATDIQIDVSALSQG